MTDNTKTNMTDNIWGALLKELVGKIKEADDKSYSINLLEEVKMANKFVRETKKNEGKDVSLRVNVDENANSRILAKLLQYKSPDGKYEILQSLLDYIRDRDENAVQNFGDIKIDNDNTIITTEETLNQETLNQETQNKDNGRIDILVRTGSNAIIFENKLFEAGDQPKQLARYIEKVKGVKQNGESKYKDENIFVIYLSRDGDEPAPDSWESPTKPPYSYSGSFEDRYANFSFREDIRLWLKDCVLLNVRKKDTDLESALVQYINYLDRMFMKNNDVLTNWLEEGLKKGERESNEPDHMVKIHRLEKVEELIATLKKDQPSRSKISVEKLKDFINSETNEDLTNEDLLNKTIAVIENLRDNCRDKVLEPFYRVSKSYFDIIHVSSLSAAYCWLLKNKKWEGEIRFIWNPFFFSDEIYNDNLYHYPLMLDIQHSSNKEKFNERIKKLKAVFPNGVYVPQEVIELQNNLLKKMELWEISHEILSNDLNSIDNKQDDKMHSILKLVLKTKKKLLYFDPEVQETLFRAIYESLSGVIEAIDNCFQNPV